MPTMQKKPTMPRKLTKKTAIAIRVESDLLAAIERARKADSRRSRANTVEAIIRSDLRRRGILPPVEPPAQN